MTMAQHLRWIITCEISGYLWTCHRYLVSNFSLMTRTSLPSWLILKTTHLSFLRRQWAYQPAYTVYDVKPLNVNLVAPPVDGMSWNDIPTPHPYIFRLQLFVSFLVQQLHPPHPPFLPCADWATRISQWFDWHREDFELLASPSQRCVIRRA